MDTTIENKLKAMIVERLFMRISPDEIENDKSLIETYGIDSVSLLELVVGIEEVFDIPVGDDDFDVKHFETVDALADFVRKKGGE